MGSHNLPDTAALLTDLGRDSNGDAPSFATILNRRLLDADKFLAAPDFPSSRPFRIAIVSLLFIWPSTGGGIVHTAELAQFLSLDGCEVCHVFAVYEPWSVGKVTESLTYNTCAMQFDEPSWSPLGARSTTVYNTTSQVAASISPIGTRTSFTYPNGQRTSTRNAVGAIWTTIFDNNKGQLAAIDPLGLRTTTLNNAGCTPVASVSPEGARTTNVFQNGLLAATINPLGLRTSLSDNVSGQRIRSKSPLGRIATTVYDTASRPVATISPSGLRSTTVYDSASRKNKGVKKTKEKNKGVRIRLRYFFRKRFLTPLVIPLL